MIAVSFFDSLAGNGDILLKGEPSQIAPMADLAAKYADSALADWKRILECEDQYGSTEFATPAAEAAANRSLYDVYQKWAIEAEQVLIRARQLATRGCRIDNAEALEDAYGRIQARLKLTPEMIERAKEQIRLGQGIPIKELRDGLPARVRP
jgi:hypothetical protein